MLATHQPVPGTGAGSVTASQVIAGLFDDNEGSCAAAAIALPMLPAPPRQKPFKPPTRLEGPAQQRREHQPQQMQVGDEVIDLSGLPESSAPAAGGWQQRRQLGHEGWHVVEKQPPQVQPFWQASEEEDEQDGWNVPGMQQQQQQEPDQELQPFWQAPDDDDDDNFATGPSLPPAEWQAGAAAGAGSGGSGGSGSSGQQPWWARLPDFVPVAALRGGRDPRCSGQASIGQMYACTAGHAAGQGWHSCRLPGASPTSHATRLLLQGWRSGLH